MASKNSLKTLMSMATFLISVAYVDAASAQTAAAKSSARELARSGGADFKAERYDAAATKYGDAFELVKVPMLGLWHARSLEKAGRLVEAAEAYLAASRAESDGSNRAKQDEARASATEERESLLLRIPKVVVELDGAKLEDVQVTVDGKSFPPTLFRLGVPVDPGARVVEAIWGERVVRVELDVVEGARETASLDFSEVEDEPEQTEPLPMPIVDTRKDQGAAPHRYKRIGWAVVGVGAAGLVAGGVSGYLAINRESKLYNAGCTPDGDCFADQRDEINEFETMRMVSIASLATGGLLVAGGTALILLAPARSEEVSQHQGVRVTPIIGIGSAGLQGSF